MVALGISRSEVSGQASSSLLLTPKPDFARETLLLLWLTDLTMVHKKGLVCKAETEIVASGGAVEASSIYKSGNYFYLFTSWDACCKGNYTSLDSWGQCFDMRAPPGTSSTYSIRVGRSSSYVLPPKIISILTINVHRISGPYVDAHGVHLTNGGGTLVFGSHDSVSTAYQFRKSSI